MSLQRLPPELLLLVIKYLGAPFFREDVRRLTLFKLWYPFARNALLVDLKVSTRTLAPFISAPGAEERFESVKSTLREVEFAFDGLDRWDSIVGPRQPGPDALYLIEEESFYENLIQDLKARAQDLEARAQWTTSLDDSLSKMTFILGTCHKLQTLRLRTFRETNSIIPWLSRPDYIYGQTMSRLLSLGNLTTLEMDTCGTSFLPSEGEERREYHICSYIRRLLPQLHCLRLRMRQICFEALSLPEDYNNEQLKLSELIVNICLGTPSTKIQCAHLCTAPGCHFVRTRDEVEKCVKRLAKFLDYPRIVRVLSHGYETPRLQSLDIITGKRIDLPFHSPWLGNIEPE